MINREASAQAKGMRLQRLRAIKLLIDKMKEYRGARVFAATEYIDDVYVKVADEYFVEEIAEGDKNYDPNKTFSFLSYEVRNSLVIFIDCFLKYNSKTLYHCFYTNINIAREYHTKRVKKMNVNLPDRPIISLLIEKNYSYPYLLDAVKKIIIYEYTEQYKNRKDKGFLSELCRMNDELWIEFLDRIDWKFGQENEKELEEILIEDVRFQEFYNEINLAGKETYVISRLLDELEKRQSNEGYLEKLVSDDFVRVTMLEVGAVPLKGLPDDPVYKIWEELDPSDNRNFLSKIESVCNDFSKKKVSRLSRKISMVKMELDNVSYEKRAAYQLRIYDACEECLESLVREHKGVITEDVIDAWIQQLEKYAVNHLADKSGDFQYAFKSKDTVKNTIWNLIDSCYLAFDEG